VTLPDHEYKMQFSVLMSDLSWLSVGDGVVPLNPPIGNTSSPLASIKTAASAWLRGGLAVAERVGILCLCSDRRTARRWSPNRIPLDPWPGAEEVGRPPGDRGHS